MRSLGSGVGNQDSNRIYLPHLRHQLTKARFDTLAERDRGSAASRTGTAEAQQQDAVRLVEVHHLDLSPVRGDVGAEGVEGLLDAGKGVGHGREYKR